MAGTKRGQPGEKLISANPQASYQYHLGERFEAGIALLGTEVKAAREGRVNLKEAYVQMREEEAFLVNCHIGAYSSAGYAEHEPTRPRKLLLHKRELRKLQGKLTLRGLTLVPTRMYARDGRLKLEIALAEGKKLHDKREATRIRETDREMRRQLKER